MNRIKVIQKFRESTGLPLLTAKECVEAANLDFDKAIEIARQRGYMNYKSKTERAIDNGIIASYISSDQTRGAIIRLSCSTDFAARTDIFKESAQLIAHGLVIGVGEEERQKILNNLELMIREPVVLSFEVFDTRSTE